MRILLVGLGSIGRRHLRNLAQVVPEAEIGVWRQYSTEADLGDLTPLVSQVFFNAEDALAWAPLAALLANPASMHVETGLLLARAGVHLFVEKPLSHNLEGVDELIEVCRQKGLVLMVGYNLRFYPPLQTMHQTIKEGRIGRPLYLRAEVGQYLPDWRPGADYRHGVSARSELGGGALLELSHELDYARWLLGEVEAVSATMGRLSELDMDVEDMAEIILRFASGAIGSVHLDMVQRAPVRTCKIVGSEGTLSWDKDGHKIQLYSTKVKKWKVIYEEPTFDFNQVYIAELEHLLACIEKKASPVVDGETGYKILKTSLATKTSSQEKKEIQL